MFGAAHLLVLLVFVVLVLDSRRLHALVRSTGRGRRGALSGNGIPPGADSERVGLRLGQIQLRNHVDWQDGGGRWEGPEILPVDEPDAAPSRESEPSRLLPVLWAPFPALTSGAA